MTNENGILIFGELNKDYSIKPVVKELITKARSLKEKIWNQRIMVCVIGPRINYENIIFQKGRNWFSITHGLAELVVKEEPWIREIFKKSVCGDELFLQTIARSSEYAEKICNQNTMPEIADTRFIDWQRGSNNNPYVFRESDYEELKASKALFARKFDLNIDKKIVEKLGAEAIDKIYNDCSVLEGLGIKQKTIDHIYQVIIDMERMR